MGRIIAGGQSDRQRPRSPLSCKRNVLAHREGRTRSLQITVGCNLHPPKSLTLYPIELGGLVFRFQK
jgi:hypothetical protein